MPATNPGITPDQVYALKRGEDAALEQLFRSRADSLREEAFGQLGDEGSAARVVERVFVAVWKERAHFETPGEVDEFLARTLHDAIVRERSRLAVVHRFEETEHVHPGNGRHAPPSPEAQWNHISAAIHAPPPDAEKTAHLLADQSRHATAVHVEQIATQSNWKTAVIIGVIAVVFAAGLIFALDRASAGAKVDAAFNSPDVRTLSTTPGQRGEVELRDGGSATLGPRSTLIIPPGYGEEFRAVKVEGAAQLRSGGGIAEPIEARLVAAPVVVTGTGFSVSAYPNAAEFMIRADAGDVQVRTDTGVIAVARGQAIVIGRTGEVRTPSATEVEEVLGWTAGQFVVVDRPLREALAAMRMAYGTDILAFDGSLLDRIVTVRAPLTSSKDAIEAMEATGNLSFGWDKEQMVFRDAAPAPARRR